MLNFLDTSNWQGGYNPALTGAGAIIVKATEGTNFIDPYCDQIVQSADIQSIPWGFYHFAGEGNPLQEADYFVDNCLNYFKYGIPVLDWEGNQDVEWVNCFVGRVHERSNVWPWIYANPWRFAQGDVNKNCARWVASYPNIASPTWEQAQDWDCPSADGNVVAWQFCSDGRVNGIDGNVDLDLFYGDADQWRAYALGGNVDAPNNSNSSNSASASATLENNEYKVTIERKQ